LRGHDETIAQRLERDLVAFQRPLPPAYDACEKVATRVSSLSLVRYRLNDCSVPTTYGHRDVLVRGSVHEVVISCGAEVITRRHNRSASLPGVDRAEDQRARSGGAPRSSHPVVPAFPVHRCRNEILFRRGGDLVFELGQFILPVGIVRREFCQAIHDGLSLPERGQCVATIIGSTIHVGEAFGSISPVRQAVAEWPLFAHSGHSGIR
jgi:hypothetical protein